MCTLMTLFVPISETPELPTASQAPPDFALYLSHRLLLYWRPSRTLNHGSATIYVVQLNTTRKRHCLLRFFCSRSYNLYISRCYLYNVKQLIVQTSPVDVRLTSALCLCPDKFIKCMHIHVLHVKTTYSHVNVFVSQTENTLARRE